MADGYTHEKYLRLFWYPIILIGLIWYALSDWNYLYPFFLYFNFLLTEILSPDIDHSMITRDEHDAKRFFKAISPAFFLPKKIFKSKKWKRIRGILSKINLGVIGALYVSWSQMYEYFASIFGGHRSWVSHGVFVGTITRMIWFNLPIYLGLSYMVNYSIVNWGTPSWEEAGFRHLYMTIWLVPYVVTQAVAWFIADGCHLVLDGAWVKGRLYGFAKFGDKRSLLLKGFINKDWIEPKTKRKIK